jgi:hypothetical protein
VQGGGDGGLVHDAPAGHDQQEGAGAHRGQLGSADQAPGLGGDGDGHGDHVRLAQQGGEAVQVPQALDVRRAGDVVGVQGDDAHVEAGGALGDGVADAPQADDPHGHPGEADQGPAGPGPGAPLLGGDELVHPPGAGEEHGEGVLGDGLGVGPAGVGDGDVARDHLGAAGDPLHPGPLGLHPAQAPRGAELLRGESQGVDAVGVGDGRRQLVAWGLHQLQTGVLGAQRRDVRRVRAAGDDDLHLSLCPPPLPDMIRYGIGALS